mgnify:CR=1 FL=1
MSRYQDIMGHQGPIEQLERARRGGRVAHAYLFHGPDGVGKQRVALAFAQALNCGDAARAPCGECESCRKIERFNHPDVRLVASEAHLVKAGLLELERGTPSLQIRNEQLAELAALFRHRPYLGRTKVVLVVDAERLNESAQNRFLKTLEEPSADSVIILVTAHPEALLPTIRSRCQALVFGPLARSVVSRALETERGLEPERARVLAGMAHGSLGRALELAEERIWDARDEAIEALARARGGDLAALLEAAEAVGAGGAGRERLEGLLELLELWLRDLLLCRLGVAESMLINRDRSQQLRREADGLAPGRLLRWLEKLRATRGSLRANANPRLALEGVLLEMRRA